ncbi:MAG: GNAT family N-acetyltransferase [Acidimicrobiales bacterium]
MTAVPGCEPEPEPERAISLRPLERADRDRLADMLGRLSPMSRYRRFFTPLPRLPASLVKHMAEVDHDRHEAIAALVGDDIIGIAEYVRSRDHPAEAEIAVTVEDGWQRHGVARLLTTELGRTAARRGIVRFVADVLAENRPAISMIHRLAPRATVTPDGRDIQVVIPLRRRRREGGGCPMLLVRWPGAA